MNKISKEFFHVRLTGVLELIKQGKLEEAKTEINDHQIALIDAERNDEVVFSELISLARRYTHYLDKAKKRLKKAIAELSPEDRKKLWMRTRGLLYIKCLREDEPYSNRLLFSYLEKKGLEKSAIKELYALYSIVRDNKRLEYSLNDYGLIRRLLKITKELLDEINHGKKKI